MNKITAFFYEISQETKNWLKNCHNYSNLAHRQILFYMHQQPMVPDHGTQYEENLASHHGWMHKDGHTDGVTDWTLSYIP